MVGDRFLEGYKAEGLTTSSARGASARCCDRGGEGSEGRDRRSSLEQLLHGPHRQLFRTGAKALRARLQDLPAPDLVATRAWLALRAVEIPYTFGARQHGESKLDSMVALDFLGLVLAKVTNDIVSLRFLLFMMVGSIGLVVHLTTLFIALKLFQVPFAEGAGRRRDRRHDRLIFSPNNFLTHRDQQLRGSFDPDRALSPSTSSAASACFLNHQQSPSRSTDQEPIWWLAGMAGALMGVVPELRRCPGCSSGSRNSAPWVGLTRGSSATPRCESSRWSPCGWSRRPTTPITFDEAPPAGCGREALAGADYYDHPPMVACCSVSTGTMIAGDAELGVRLMLDQLRSLADELRDDPRSAAILFNGARVAAPPTLHLLNVTMLASVGTMIVTPDAPLLMASRFVLSILPGQGAGNRPRRLVARGRRRGRRRAAVELHRVDGPRARRSWSSSGTCPSCGAGFPFALALPRRHRRVRDLRLCCSGMRTINGSRSSSRWSGRGSSISARSISLNSFRRRSRYKAFPAVFILPAMGLHALTWRRISAPSASRVLVETMFWTIVAYFVWHSLQPRVGAGWFAPVYPAFVVAADDAPHRTMGARGRATDTVSPSAYGDPCSRHAHQLNLPHWSLQASTGVLSDYRRDATVRSVGVGWRAVADEIEAVRLAGATCSATITAGGWLAFYLPRGTCALMQRSSRIRWSTSRASIFNCSKAGIFVDRLRAGGHRFHERPLLAGDTRCRG